MLSVIFRSLSSTMQSVLGLSLLVLMTVAAWAQADFSENDKPAAPELRRIEIIDAKPLHGEAGDVHLDDTRDRSLIRRQPEQITHRSRSRTRQPPPPTRPRPKRANDRVRKEKDEDGQKLDIEQREILITEAGPLLDEAALPANPQDRNLVRRQPKRDTFRPRLTPMRPGTRPGGKRRGQEEDEQEEALEDWEIPYTAPMQLLIHDEAEHENDNQHADTRERNAENRKLRVRRVTEKPTKPTKKVRFSLRYRRAPAPENAQQKRDEEKNRVMREAMYRSEEDNHHADTREISPENEKPRVRGSTEKPPRRNALQKRDEEREAMFRSDNDNHHADTRERRAENQKLRVRRVTEKPTKPTKKVHFSLRYRRAPAPENAQQKRDEEKNRVMREAMYKSEGREVGIGDDNRL